MDTYLYRLGRASARHRRYVSAAWLLVAALALAAAGAFGGELSDRVSVPESGSKQAVDMLEQRFPETAGGSAQLVFEARDGTLSEPPMAGEVDAVLADVAEQPHVVDVGRVRLAPDRTIGYADVQYNEASFDLGAAAVKRLTATADRAAGNGLRVELGGEIPGDADAAADDPSGQEIAGLVAAVLVLLFAFGSLVAMSLPIGTALFGLATSTGVIGLLAAVIEVSDPAQTLAMMVGLGVGIDYALLIVTRHRENLHAGMTVEDAAGRAIATAGASVLFAALTVMIAICGLAVVGLPFMNVVGFIIAVAVGVMAAASLTLVPAVLGFAGRRINALRIPGSNGRPHSVGGETWWHRFGRRVTAQPWPWLLAGLGVLVALTIPVFGMRLGMPDAGINPPSTTTRQAYDLVGKGFGDGHNGPLLIAVALDGDGSDAATLERLSRAASTDRGVAEVSRPRVNGDGSAAVFTVVPTTAPQDEDTSELVHRLRDSLIPEALAGTGANAYVGGQSAMFIDLADRIGARLPWFIGLIVGMSLVLLMIIFRSIAVPLKAAAMNLLSIGAAFGVVVAIFQWGWARDLFGVEQRMPVVVFVPVLMFAILFGLSMDYEVFLLSRVREEYLRTGNNDTGVIEGIAATGSVITSAALVMVCVFVAFALGESQIIKMLGIGMATAIFVDATVVRMIVVPSLMTLLGTRNWWLPGWLDRVLPGRSLSRQTVEAPPSPAKTLGGA